jgi:hypothetical protein
MEATLYVCKLNNSPFSVTLLSIFQIARLCLLTFHFEGFEQDAWGGYQTGQGYVYQGRLYLYYPLIHATHALLALGL